MVSHAGLPEIELVIITKLNPSSSLRQSLSRRRVAVHYRELCPGTDRIDTIKEVSLSTR